MRRPALEMLLEELHDGVPMIVPVPSEEAIRDTCYLAIATETPERQRTTWRCVELALDKLIDAFEEDMIMPATLESHLRQQAWIWLVREVITDVRLELGVRAGYLETW